MEKVNPSCCFTLVARFGHEKEQSAAMGEGGVGLAVGSKGRGTVAHTPSHAYAGRYTPSCSATAPPPLVRLSTVARPLVDVPMLPSGCATPTRKRGAQEKKEKDTS